VELFGKHVISLVIIFHGMRIILLNNLSNKKRIIFDNFTVVFFSLLGVRKWSDSELFEPSPVAPLGARERPARIR
jgi:uncharacterized protein YhhL (DUF1145 family)